MLVARVARNASSIGHTADRPIDKTLAAQTCRIKAVLQSLEGEPCKDCGHDLSSVWPYS